jgi:hypothetical protein
VALLLGCMVAEEVWKNTELWSLVHNLILNATRFVLMVFKMIEKFDSNTMSKIAMLLWTLWWRWNKNVGTKSCQQFLK